MFKKMMNLPAGSFLVPMFISATLFTLWPNLFKIGGITEAIFGGSGVSTIVGILSFAGGTLVDVTHLNYLLKRHGLLLLIKIVFVIIIGVMFINVFGQEGIFGISAIAFITAIVSINPAIYMSLANQYGDNLDKATFGILGIFTIPTIPLIIYGISSGGSIDWLPVLSTLLPTLLGIGIRMLDIDFTAFLSAAIPPITFLMGWNIGQTMNLVDSLQAGLGGIILVLLYYLFNSPLFVVDKLLLKENGLFPLMTLSMAGVSAASPLVVSLNYPVISAYVVEAQTQLLMGVLITSILTPIIVGKVFKNQEVENARK